MDNNLYIYTLRMADNALILGQRLADLCSKAPFLEEDLAQTNIALDYIGRAQTLYNYASTLNNSKKSEDEIAYRREEIEYYNLLLVEQPDEDFAFTIIRQFFYSTFDCLFYNELITSTNRNISSIAKKVIKESKYHLSHSTNWVLRLGDGTTESNRRMQNAIDSLWMYTSELFEMDEVDKKMIERGIGIDLEPLKTSWLKEVSTTFSEAKLSIPQNNYMIYGGKQGHHTEYMGHILSELQYLQRTYPDAQW